MRSVVLKSSRRCPRCRLHPRWCICAAHRDLRCPLAIDVLIHHRERHRPSSTGNLIQRLIPESRQHLWRRERRLAVTDVHLPPRELWILHPRGQPVPAGCRPENVQLLLLDGSWREAAAMVQEIGTWGRMVGLPMMGQSRYWLRAQHDSGHVSTVEALAYVLESLGLAAVSAELRRQFELHVYASLRARGHKALAEEFLAGSPLAAAYPEVLAQLDARRPA
ncbi:MAG TPA: DTW domain-containing protein [Opitutaceae bacterium]|nr:DTW domain-containing protein [Opitutaceae bacterium]